MIYKALRKQDAFFSVFNQLATLATEAVTELRRLFASLPVKEEDATTMSRLESQSDQLQIDLNLQLAKTFITPLDREDIHRLANGLKGVLDALHGSAHRAVYFRVEQAPEDALEMIDLAAKAIKAIDEAVLCLQTGKSVAHLREVVTDCERQGDDVSRKAIGQMFEQRLEVYELLKWKELFERLESLLDRCEDAFIVVETLSVKYA